MKINTFLPLILLLSISGCSYKSRIIYGDEQSVTVDHNFDMFADGMKTAVQKCAAYGKNVKHESTSCQAGWHRCVSTFKCTNSKDQSVKTDAGL